MLRGFGTATNATLKELLASDTDGAEDPGAEGDDVDAFVRAASPLFGASDEPWTHESIKPPATPPRSPDGDGTDTDPFPPTPPSFQERAATATAALQRMLDASPTTPPSPLTNCTAATRLHARDAAAGVGDDAKKRLAELLRDSSSESEDEAPAPAAAPPPSEPIAAKSDAEIMESIEDLIEDPRPPSLVEEAAAKAKEAVSGIVDALSPAKTARAPSPVEFDEEGDDSDGDAAPAPASAAAPPDDDDAALNRAEAAARNEEGGVSDDGEDHEAPRVLQEEITPPASTVIQPVSATSSRWETEDEARSPDRPAPKRKSLKKMFASGAKGIKKRLMGRPKVVDEGSDEDKRSSSSSARRPEEISEYAADLEKKLALLQAHAGLNDDELEWKLASTETADPYGLAKAEREKAEGDYDRLMWDESRCDQVAKLADDVAVLRALEDVVEASQLSSVTAAQEFEKSSAAHAAERALATSPVKEKQSMAREDSIRSVGGHEACDVDDDAQERDAAATLPRDAEDASDAPEPSKRRFSEQGDDAEPARPPNPFGKGKGKGNPMAGGLLAAIAGRGRGGPPGRGRGAAPPGGLLAAIAGRGRGRGLGAALSAPRKKKPKTLSSAKAALVKARARAAADAARLPVQLPEFSIVETCTAPVIAALVDETDDDQSHAGKARRASATILKCDAAAAAASAALALLRETAKEARREGDRLRTNLRDVEGALDVWRARERDAPNRAAKLAEEEREWSRREEAANAAALALIRTLVPPDIKGDTVEGLRHRAARVVAQAAAQAKRRKRFELRGNPPRRHPSLIDHTGEAEGEPASADEPVSDKKALAIAAAWGGCYTYALAERLKNARPLHWVQAHPDDVATQNFLAGAGADSFRNLGDYDVVELRAIYAACPEKFQLDSSGAKAAWRRQLVERLRELVARERGDRVNAGWDGATGQRRTQQLPPLPAKQRRHPAYYYPSKAQLEETAQKHKTLKKRRDERKKKVATLEAALEERRDERDAAFADSRSEYLQQQYGRQLLRDLAREADDAYKATSKELGNDVQGARADYLRAAKAVDNAHPTESEDAALRKLVERHSLCDGDALADARDVAALRKRALAKAGIYDDEEDDVTEDDERVLKHVFAEEPRGRLVRGPFDPWPAIERAERAPVLKKLSDEEEARLRREELRQHGLSRRKSLSTKEVAKTLSAASASSSARPSVRRVASAKPVMSSGLAPVAPRSRRLAELARKSAGGDSARDSTGST